MDAHTAKPWTRGGFKHDLETWVPAHRGELIAALLTLVRCRAPPRQAPIKMGSFQAWVNIIGGILEHNFVEDFLGNHRRCKSKMMMHCSGPLFFMPGANTTTKIKFYHPFLPGISKQDQPVMRTVKRRWPGCITPYRMISPTFKKATSNGA
jgi:hypothetical protein